MLYPSGTSIDDDAGFSTSAGAMLVALNVAQQVGLYDPRVINFTYDFFLITVSNE